MSNQSHVPPYEGNAENISPEGIAVKCMHGYNKDNPQKPQKNNRWGILPQRQEFYEHEKRDKTHAEIKTVRH